MKKSSIVPIGESHCQPCGAWCCRGEAPYASETELAALQVAAMGQKPDGSCLFLGKDGRCSKYSLRPLECRIFPFDVYIKNSALTWGLWVVCPASWTYELDATLSRFESELVSFYPPEYLWNYAKAHESLDIGKYHGLERIELREVREAAHQEVNARMLAAVR